MSLIFTVFLPNKSRYRLEISKSTPLYQGLEKVCTEKGYLPPHNFAFRYNKSYPDLSTPVGMLNLSNLTEIELVSASEVPSKGACSDTLSIALQYGTQRFNEVFSCDTSLWDLIADFGLKHTDWIPCSLDPDHHPVLVYMRQEVPGEVALRGTSLRHLGLQPGSPPALLRLAYRPVPPDKLDAANKAVEVRNAAAISAAVTAAAKPAAAATETAVEASSATVSSYPVIGPAPAPQDSTSNANLFSPFRTLPARDPVMQQHQQQREPRTLAEALNLPSFEALSGLQEPQEHLQADLLPRQPFRFPQETAGQDLYRNELADVKPKEFAPCDRRLCVYMAGSLGASATACSASDAASSDEQMEEPDDSFFNLTESDMRKLMADLKRKVDEVTNAPLLTRQQRDQQRDDLYSSYELSVIRLFFPDKHVVQAVFRPRETVYSLCKFVRTELLHSTEADFFLYTTPPKKEIKDMDQFLIHADLVPMPIVYVGFRTQVPDGQRVLKDAIVSMTTSRDHCDKEALNCMRPAIEPIYARQQQQQQQQHQQQSARSASGASTNGRSSNMPKWFKK